jgi:hypothetical protein
MWPELGARLEYLIDYPHGCVEQTTSSTLPLLVARDILPRIGLVRFGPEKLEQMAAAGLERLASMRTDSGGLAYWPGGHEPDLYGTAYAMRAVALASAEDLPVPAGLQDGMRDYLQAHLSNESGSSARDVEIRAAVALALAEAKALPESAADMLIDTVDSQGVFGLANLALALSTLEGHDEDVTTLLDRIEGAYDEHGKLTASPPEGELFYYGSSTRTIAQSALALIRLRPASKLLPLLIEQLVRNTGAYTTQATAFGLVTLREHVLRTEATPREIRASLDGVLLTPDVLTSVRLGGGARRYELPRQGLEGRRGLLHLESSSELAVSFLIESRWRRPFDAEATGVATSAKSGPEVYRIYTDPRGNPIDPTASQPGQVVRVALMARLPVERVSWERLGFLAMTDRLPAGFEPIQPDLWTVSRPSELEAVHPLHSLLRYGAVDASHVELRDDRVQLYFDRVWGEYVAATYLMRATTPGTFVAPPAMAELMYEPDSIGYSDTVHWTVKP